jgi:hypothetical protein
VVVQDGSNSYTLKDVTANDLVQVTFLATSMPARMVSPVPGSTFTSSTETFKWSAGVGVADYDLYVGTAVGAANIYNSGILPLGTLSKTVTGIPTNGGTIYVKLWSYISGAWQSINYTYTAAKPVVTYTVTPIAEANGIISPSTAQKVASGGSITFTATPDPGYVVYHWVANGVVAQVGSTSFTLKDVTSNENVAVTFIAQTAATSGVAANPTNGQPNGQP